MSFMDFNDAESTALIPSGATVPVKLSIKHGGYNDISKGLTDGVATRNQNGAIFLNCEYTVTAGKYKNKKIYDVIGIHSNKGPKWAQMGRSFIRALLNSSRGVADRDNSERAQNARRIRTLKELDGLEFMVIVGTEQDKNGKDINCINRPINPDEKAYRGFIPATRNSPARYMGEITEEQEIEQQVANLLAWPR